MAEMLVADMRRASDDLLIQMSQTLGEIRGTQQEQSKQIHDLDSKVTKHIALESAITEMMKRQTNLETIQRDHGERIALLEHRVTQNRADIIEHAAKDEPIKDFFVRHAATIITAGLAMLGTAIASKIPALIDWFRGL